MPTSLTWPNAALFRPIPITLSGSSSSGEETSLASTEQLAFERETVQHLLALQRRVVAAPPTLPARPKDLHDQVRVVLMKAVQAELLTTGAHRVSCLLSKVVESSSPGGRAYAFSCGPIDFDRGPASPTNSLVRSDGATLSFSVTLGQPLSSPTLELIAYRFDLTLPRDSLLRFDLDRANSGHSDQGLRAHIHAGKEEIRVPSAIFHPLEALRFLLVHPRPELGTSSV